MIVSILLGAAVVVIGGLMVVYVYGKGVSDGYILSRLDTNMSPPPSTKEGRLIKLVKDEDENT